MVKLWRTQESYGRVELEHTKGTAEDLKAKYPYIFDCRLPNLEDEIHLKGVEL